MFVTNWCSQNVSVINASSGQVTATIPSGPTTWGHPTGVIYDPDNGMVYVANGDSNSTHNGTVTAINASANSATGTVDVGDTPIGIAYDGASHRAYVTNIYSASVSVINVSSAKVIAWITGSASLWPAYDNANHYVYVASSGPVRVVNTSSNKIVNSISTTALGTYGLAVDSANGDVYVAGRNNDILSIIDGTTNTEIASVTVGKTPEFVTVDSGNSLVYVTNFASNNVSIINATTNTVLGSIQVGPNPLGIAFLPSNGDLYVANNNGSVGTGTVTVISTELGETPPVGRTPQGAAISNMDLGQNLTVATTLWAVGSGGNTGTVSVAPSVGFGCGSVNGPTNYGDIRTICTPSAPGTYSVWLNDTDSTGHKVWGRANFTVFADPTLSLRANRTALDLGQTLKLDAIPTGGSGGFTYNWTGLPGGCLPTNLYEIVCAPTVGGIARVSVVATDSAGVVTPPKALTVTVSPTLIVGVPTVTPTQLDAGHWMTIQANAQGGSAWTSISWSGLPPGCSSSNSSGLTCAPMGPGIFAIGVQVSDRNGVTVASPPATVTVFPVLTVSNMTARGNPLDLGEPLLLTVGSNGGMPPVKYVWSSLPPGCYPANRGTISCTPTLVGQYYVEVWVNDSNGATILSGVSVDVTPMLGLPTVTASPSASTLGTPIDLRAIIGGGSGSYSYAWHGLPAGCSGGNDSGFRCIPTSTGTFSVAVTITDSTGANRTSSTVTVEVTPPSVIPGIGGLPWGYVAGIAVAALVMVVLSVVWALSKRRRGKAPAAPAISRAQPSTVRPPI